MTIDVYEFTTGQWTFTHSHDIWAGEHAPADCIQAAQHYADIRHDSVQIKLPIAMEERAKRLGIDPYKDVVIVNNKVNRRRIKVGNSADPWSGSGTWMGKRDGD